MITENKLFAASIVMMMIAGIIGGLIFAWAHGYFPVESRMAIKRPICSLELSGPSDGEYWCFMNNTDEMVSITLKGSGGTILGPEFKVPPKFTLRTNKP